MNAVLSSLDTTTTWCSKISFNKCIFIYIFCDIIEVQHHYTTFYQQNLNSNCFIAELMTQCSCCWSQRWSQSSPASGLVWRMVWSATSVLELTRAVVRMILTTAGTGASCVHDTMTSVSSWLRGRELRHWSPETVSPTWSRSGLMFQLTSTRAADLPARMWRLVSMFTTRWLSWMCTGITMTMSPTASVTSITGATLPTLWLTSLWSQYSLSSCTWLLCNQDLSTISH